MTTKTFVVPGISCGHCTHTIESELAELAGVQSVKADQATKQVTVAFAAPATWEKIKDTLQEINYPPIMRKLLDVGYQGWVGQEFIPTRDPLAGLKQAVALCDV